MDESPWPAVGKFIKDTRIARGLGLRGADRASGVKDPTWRRVEGGQGITAENLYGILAVLGVEEEEAKKVFDRVGLNFDRAQYRRPPAIDQMESALQGITRALAEAKRALARLESEERERR
jgi:hypothetical protein